MVAGASATQPAPRSAPAARTARGTARSPARRDDVVHQDRDRLKAVRALRRQREHERHRQGGRPDEPHRGLRVLGLPWAILTGGRAF